MSEIKHPVIEVIHQRAKTLSKPGSRSDSYKVGLVIEGGGMRGVVSAGMVTGLEYLGLSNCFDALYGASAGSLNGAFFIAGQAPYGTTIYYENINNRKFIKGIIGIVFGLLFDKPAMNLSYLFKTVLLKEKVLDWEKVIGSPIPLNVVVSSLDQRKAVVMNNFKSRDELFSALEVGATIPFIAGSPTIINNERLWDASFYDSIPVDHAIKDNCTHILVLRTRPEGILRGQPSIIEKYYLPHKIDKLKPKGLGEDFLKKCYAYDDIVKNLDESQNNPEAVPYVYSVKLSKGTKITNPMEKRKSKLIQGAVDGLNASLSTFSAERISVHHILHPFIEQSGQKIDIHLEYDAENTD